MRTRKRIKWVVLVAVPLVIALGMWPVAQRHRQQAKVQEAREATLALQTMLNGHEHPYPDRVRQLVTAGANVNVANDLYNTTVLHVAVCSPDFESVRLPFIRLLLAHGADINAGGAGEGVTPLMMAVRSTQPEVVRLLLDNGANVNRRTREGETPTASDLFFSFTALTMAKETLRQIRQESPAQTPQQRSKMRVRLRDANLIIQMLKASGGCEWDRLPGG